jgi:hypothetical protein
MKQGQYLPTQLALVTEYATESRYYSVYSVYVEEGSQQEGTPPPPPAPQHSLPRGGDCSPGNSAYAYHM